MFRTRVTNLSMAVIVCMILAISAIVAGGQNVLTVQGLLSDSGGQPLNGAFDLTFNIYPGPTDPTSLWTEVHTGVNVTEGLFSVELGLTTPIDPTLFDGSDRYLGITVDSDPELTPRRLMGASPYAVRAESVKDLKTGPGNEVLGNYSFAAGDSNTVHDDYSTIAGGEHNVIEILNFADTIPDTSVSPGAIVENSSRSNGERHAVATAFIGTAFGNHAHGAYSGVLAGRFDSAAGAYSTIGAGFRNITEFSAAYSVIGGGYRNLARDLYGTIGGGIFNQNVGGAFFVGSTISGGILNLTGNHAATIGGGYRNAALSFATTIGGGYGNISNSNYSTIAGGYANQSPGTFSIVGGGQQNLAIGTHTSIGGGQSDSALGSHSTIGGGLTNVTIGDYSSIGGGHNNRAAAYGSTIGGGEDNSCLTNPYQTIGGGQDNLCTDPYATIAGGLSNRASTWATVGGGLNNQALNEYTVVAGGHENVANAYAAAVLGGEFNNAAATHSTVGGGYVNVAQGDSAFVGGGNNNVATGVSSIVTGGSFNNSLANYATVSGGSGNISTADYTTIGGGARNLSTGIGGTVGGGSGNTAGPGANSTVPGGLDNEATGIQSFAAGSWALANDTCAFVWSDCCIAADGLTHPLLSTGANSWTARATGGFYLLTGCDSAFSSVPGTPGVYLPPGGSTWLTASHSSMKRNIRSVDGAAILDRLDKLNINRWSYTAQDESIEHIGPMAEDFYNIFEVGDNDRTISYIDPAGVALAAVKELHKKTKQLEEQSKKIDQLEAKLEKLAKLIEDSK